MDLRLLVTGVISVFALEGTGRADVVIEWNNVVLESVRATSTYPPMASRAYAMVHTAMFDAINGVYRQYAPYRIQTPAPDGTSAEAAAVCAAYAVLVDLYPERIDIYNEALHDSLDDVSDGPAKFKGRVYGRFVGNGIVRLRRNDGAFDTVDYEPSGEIGHWAPTPPGYLDAVLPNWPFVKPWAMTHGSQFRADQPPKLDTAKYAAAFNEVKDIGRIDSATRTAEQTEIAMFWSDHGGTVTPPGHWLQIAQIFADMFDNDLLENARLFALLAITQADAGIAAWDCKYEFDHWRPVTGIWMADLDDNPNTLADPTWLPLIVTPAFPSCTSGHSTFSGGSSMILALFYGSDDIAFTSGSPSLPGVERSWNSLSEAAEEAGQSRIYGGIHWQYDNLPALEAGRKLADYVFANFLQPLHD